MSFIGGNLDDIEASAARLIDSGASAVATGHETHSAAVVLAQAIDEAMTTLLARFESVADGLTNDIASAHSVLAGSDWQGQSRENALVIKEQLQGRVNGVLASASSNLAVEKGTFMTRAQALVDAIQADFQRVMTDVDGEYGSLAAASRRTRDNLALADQTIGAM